MSKFFEGQPEETPQYIPPDYTPDEEEVKEEDEIPEIDSDEDEGKIETQLDELSQQKEEEEEKKEKTLHNCCLIKCAVRRSLSQPNVQRRSPIFRSSRRTGAVGFGLAVTD